MPRWLVFALGIVVGAVAVLAVELAHALRLAAS